MQRNTAIEVSQSDIAGYHEDPAHESIKDIAAFKDRILNRQAPRGAESPWPKATEREILFPPRELSIWAGVDSHRKSTILGQVLLDFMVQGQRVFIASLELPLEDLVDRMVTQWACVPEPSQRAKEAFVEWASGKLFIYDRQDYVGVDHLVKAAAYCADVLKVDHVAIDSLMFVDIRTDDFDEQKLFVARLMSVAKKYETHIHLVCHFTKIPDGQKPSRKHIAGSKAISNIACNIFIVWMNEQKVEEKEKAPEYRDPKIMEKPEMILIVDKQRFRRSKFRLSFEVDDRSMQMIQHKRKEYHALCNVKWG